MLSAYLDKLRSKGLTTSFVPTMGALHRGHISLITQAKQIAPISVCSIFVNPTQFNDASDYNKYPSRVAADIKLLSDAGNDVLFLPSVASVYQEGMSDLESYDLGYLETIFEGKYRPGHFQGVCQVMSRLLKAVRPDFLVMGLKDYQQCLVVKQLMSIIRMDTKFVGCATLREPDGLAMSSRNLRLDDQQRAVAPAIFHALFTAKQKVLTESHAVIEKQAMDELNENGFRVEYFSIVNSNNLLPDASLDKSTPLVALTAAYLGEVRLIDNMFLTD